MPKELPIIDFEIIWKKINHITTENEEILLAQWLEETPDHQQYLDKVIRYYREGSSFDDNHIETSKAWKALKKELLKKKHSPFKQIISITAAAVVIIFLIVNFLLPVKKN